MSSFRSAVLRAIRPIHRKLRGQKLDLFFQSLDGAPPGSLLDLGGGPGISGEFLSLYRRFARVTVANLHPIHLDAAHHPNVQPIVADGCALPFPDHSFDWVFSNAVIEHVGDWQRQVRFASEIRRVAATGYFVSTPNRYFPLEPHTLIPFYQFFPDTLQRHLAPFSPGYVTAFEEIHLLSAVKLRSLFPEAAVVPVGFPVIGNSLVAVFSAG